MWSFQSTAMSDVHVVGFCLFNALLLRVNYVMSKLSGVVWKELLVTAELTGSS